MCLGELGFHNELCMLFPTARAAKECIFYMSHQCDRSAGSDTGLRHVYLNVEDPVHTQNYLELHVAFFPSDLWKLAKSFWQHAGMGVSSRYSEACLSFISQSDAKLK